jgi:hypothetical protein
VRPDLSGRSDPCDRRIEKSGGQGRPALVILGGTVMARSHNRPRWMDLTERWIKLLTNIAALIELIRRSV